MCTPLAFSETKTRCRAIRTLSMLALFCLRTSGLRAAGGENIFAYGESYATTSRRIGGQRVPHIRLFHCSNAGTKSDRGRPGHWPAAVERTPAPANTRLARISRLRFGQAALPARPARRTASLRVW